MVFFFVQVWEEERMDEKQADFMIKSFGEFELFGHEIHITTTHISLLVVSAILLVFAVSAKKCIHRAKITDRPGMFQNIVEIIVEKLSEMAQQNQAMDSQPFFYYIGTLFLFLIVSNLSGLIGIRPPTADFGVTLMLALISFFIIQIHGIRRAKGKHFRKLFEPVPFLFPINLIGELAVPVSLSLRLFGNMLSGTVMMGLVYGLFPIIFKIGIPAVLHFYFDLFAGCIQAYVFCMLTMVYRSQEN